MRIKRTPSILRDALAEYVEARKSAEDASNRLRLATIKVLEALTAEGRKSYQYTEGDKVYRATYVASDKVDIDEAGLRKAIGAANWAKVSKTVLDRKKLEELIEAGGLQAESVGAFMTVTKSAPHIRFTEGQRKEDDDDA